MRDSELADDLTVTENIYKIYRVPEPVLYDVRINGIETDSRYQYILFNDIVYVMVAVCHIYQGIRNFTELRCNLFQMSLVCPT